MTWPITLHKDSIAHVPKSPALLASGFRGAESAKGDDVSHFRPRRAGCITLVVESDGSRSSIVEQPVLYFM